MNHDSRESLLEAVTALVVADNGPELYRDVLALIPVSRTLNAQFSGERAVLNPLVSLGASNPEQFGRVIDLIESKRAIAGLTPLVKPADNSFDKSEYMRDFMQQKRDRERRAAEIENLMRPPHDQLRGRPRIDFMQRQSARWKEQRDDALERARANNNGRLSKPQQNELLSAFWAGIDRELDGLEELARAEQLKPRHQRIKK